MAAQTVKRKDSKSKYYSEEDYAESVKNNNYYGQTLGEWEAAIDPADIQTLSPEDYKSLYDVGATKQEVKDLITSKATHSPVVVQPTTPTVDNNAAVVPIQGSPIQTAVAPQTTLEAINQSANTSKASLLPEVPAQEAEVPSPMVEAFVASGMDIETATLKAKEIENREAKDPYLNPYMNGTIKPPTAPDPKKAKNAMIGASLAQALGIVGDIFGASQGAHVKQRTDASPIEMVAAEKTRMRDLYEKKLESYTQSMNTSFINSGLYKDKKLERKHEIDLAQKQLDAKNARDDANREVDFNRKKELYGIKADADKEKAETATKNKITVATEVARLRQKYPTQGRVKAPTTAKEPKIKPEEEVAINAKFKKIPIEFKKEAGYASTKKVYDKENYEYETIVTEDEKIPAAIKKAIIEAYESRKNLNKIEGWD